MMKKGKSISENASHKLINDSNYDAQGDEGNTLRQSSHSDSSIKNTTTARTKASNNENYGKEEQQQKEARIGKNISELREYFVGNSKEEIARGLSRSMLRSEGSDNIEMQDSEDEEIDIKVRVKKLRVEPCKNVINVTKQIFNQHETELESTDIPRKSIKRIMANKKVIGEGMYISADSIVMMSIAVQLLMLDISGSAWKRVGNTNRVILSKLDIIESLLPNPLFMIFFHLPTVAADIPQDFIHAISKDLIYSLFITKTTGGVHRTIDISATPNDDDYEIDEEDHEHLMTLNSSNKTRKRNRLSKTETINVSSP